VYAEERDRREGREDGRRGEEERSCGGATTLLNIA